MATLDMGRSYELTSSNVDKYVESGRIGNYAFGYMKDNNFCVKYVGRSDNDLRSRIKDRIHINPKTKVESAEYEMFKFSYAKTVKEAFEKECKNYHDFGGDQGKLDNKNHPDSPNGEDYKCPICEIYDE